MKNTFLYCLFLLILATFYNNGNDAVRSAIYANINAPVPSSGQRESKLRFLAGVEERRQGIYKRWKSFLATKGITDHSAILEAMKTYTSTADYPDS